jgi:cytidine deaminase
MVDVTADAQTLIAAATELVEAHSDGAVHTVAAAARTSGGRVVTGLNLSHFTGGPCAELVVLANASALGDSELELMVAVGNRDRGVLAPCGRCRQVLLDYQPGIRVVMPDRSSDPAVVAIEELLPSAYVWAAQRPPPALRAASPDV